MRTRQGLARGKVAVLAATFGMFLLLSATHVQAALLFWENFDGYARFPDQRPTGDWVNLGLPEVSEGAHELWYGGRFGSGGGYLSNDLGVQKWGGNGNGSHVGRFGDRSGILFNVNSVGHEDVRLQFDWRTFLAEDQDRFRAGYYIGSLPFNGDRLRDFHLLGPAWSQWTQITAGKTNWWQHVDRSLPSGVSDLWVALWMDGGDLDFGKVDNVQVSSSRVTNPVPEPTSLMLLGGGLLVIVAGRVRWRARS